MNKSIDSVTMPKWIAAAVLGTCLLFATTSWWKAADQRDLLIELRTELRLAKEAKALETAERQRKDGDNDAWRDTMNGTLKEIKGMLSQQQINALERRAITPQSN